MANGPFSTQVLACVTNALARVPGDFEADMPDQFFQERDFAETAFWTPAAGGGQVPVLGMFDGESTEVDPESGSMHTTAPQFWVPTKSMETVARNDLLEICSILYRIKEIEPDGSGLTVLHLSKDKAS